ncbi:hypothetical protein SMICM304S_02435 [Streptomyces microflavus]
MGRRVAARVPQLHRRGDAQARPGEVGVPAAGIEFPSGEGKSGAVGHGDVVLARTVGRGWMSSGPCRVRDGEGQDTARFQASGNSGEEELGGDEADGAEDGVDRVEGLAGGLKVVQCVAGGERGAVDVAVVGAGAAYLEADQVYAGDAGLVVLCEVGNVVAGTAAQLQEALAAQVPSQDLGAGTEARVGAPFHPGRRGEGVRGGRRLCAGLRGRTRGRPGRAPRPPGVGPRRSGGGGRRGCTRGPWPGRRSSGWPAP